MLGLAPKEQHEERLATCETCPHLTPLQRCALCGCFVIIKAKVSTQSCPDRRWQDHRPGDE